MSCTRVLTALGTHPQPGVSPVDLAKYLSLSKREPLQELLSNAPQKAAQPGTLSLRRAVSLRTLRRPASTRYPSPSPLPSPSTVSSGPRSCFRRDSSGQTKKRVVFADAKGLALTAVRLFIPDSSLPLPALEIKPVPVKFYSQQMPSNKLQQVPASNKLQSYKLRLGFPQPALDITLARLREMRVQLESCNISDKVMSGRVRVSHVSAEKAVHVRVTFDSWRSHHDVPCSLLTQVRFSGSEVDIFSFDMSLPKNIDPEERIEFCVSLRTGATTHWDDNNGQNYRLYFERANANSFYHSLSKCQPTSWPSHSAVSVQNFVDPQYFQSGLLSRVRQDWDSVFS